MSNHVLELLLSTIRTLKPREHIDHHLSLLYKFLQTK